MTKKKVQILRQLFKQNKNLLERVGKEEFSETYISDDDVLLASIGKQPKQSVGIEVDDNFTVLYNPQNYKIVGLTIVDYKDWVKEKNVVNMKQRVKSDFFALTSLFHLSGSAFSFSI